jgi:GxxExxY protein
MKKTQIMNLLHKELTSEIIKAFYNVYNELGYGFLEKVYEESLLIELNLLKINCTSQQKVKVLYKDYEVGNYIPDILVENKIIVEVKAVEAIAPEHEVVLVNYLKATNNEVGLLINFGPKPQYVRRVLTKEYLKNIKQNHIKNSNI